MKTGEEYEPFVRVIGILMQMIRGDVYNVSPIHSGDVKCLSDMISDFVEDIHSDYIPLYIHKLFANIIQNVNEVHLNTFLMENHASHENKMYGYRLFKPLFYVDDMINFSKLCRLFNT